MPDLKRSPQIASRRERTVARAVYSSTILTYRCGIPPSANNIMRKPICAPSAVRTGTDREISADHGIIRNVMAILPTMRQPPAPPSTRSWRRRSSTGIPGACTRPCPLESSVPALRSVRAGGADGHAPARVKGGDTCGRLSPPSGDR